MARPSKRSIPSGGSASRPIFLGLLTALCVVSGSARAQDEGETRAVWVVRYALNTTGSVDRVVDVATQMNLNTLLVQVRGRGDAYYPSELVPRGEDLGSKPRDYDPLARICERAHAQGLEVHAWINVYLVWSAGRLPQSQLHVVNAHPDWIAVRADGQKLVEMVPEEFQEERIEGMYLAPGNPEVRRHLRDVVREIVTHYPVDGIHLDYVRNPEPDVGYDAGTRTAFMREFGVDPAWFGGTASDSTLLATVGAEGMVDLRARWLQWQREQVTAFVRDVRNDLDLINPRLKLTAAVISDQTAAENRYLQDWPRWLREGIIDAAIPMAYTPNATTFVRQMSAARAIPTEHHLFAGVGIYNQSAREAADKIRRARNMGVDGIALFSFDALAASTGYARSLKTWSFREPAEVRKMPWREKK